MKRILLAGGAIATLGAAAWAIDDDKQHTRILVSDGRQVIMNAEGRGPVVEIRGENGERTIHMERDGADTAGSVTANFEFIPPAQLFRIRPFTSSGRFAATSSETSDPIELPTRMAGFPPAFASRKAAACSRQRPME